MTKRFLFILLFLCFSSASAQIDVRNYSLIQPYENIAYRGVLNLIDVVGFESHETLLVSNSDTMQKVNGFFSYVPLSNFGIDTLEFFVDGKFWTMILFELETLENPTVNFGEKKNGSHIQYDYLLSNPGLQVSYSPQLYIPDFYVTSCELIITKFTKKGEKEMKMQINGNAFSDSQLKKLRKLNSRATLWFKSIALSTENEEFEVDLKLFLGVGGMGISF